MTQRPPVEEVIQNLPTKSDKIRELAKAGYYVGVTLRSLQGRMGQYRRGYPRQRTSFRINGLIRATLQAGKSLKIVVATPKNSEWNGLPVNTAAGLEVALIQAIRPEWNKQLGKSVH